MNIFFRDLWYNRICASELLPYRLRPYLLKFLGGGYILVSMLLGMQGALLAIVTYV